MWHYSRITTDTLYSSRGLLRGAALYCGTVGDSNACGQGITRAGGSD